MISLRTSVDDLHSSFKYSIERYTPADFEAAVLEEQNTQNRVTVIKLLKRALRLRKQGARRI